MPLVQVHRCSRQLEPQSSARPEILARAVGAAALHLDRKNVQSGSVVGATRLRTWVYANNPWDTPRNVHSVIRVVRVFIQQVAAT